MNKKNLSLLLAITVAILAIIVLIMIIRDRNQSTSDINQISNKQEIQNSTVTEKCDNSNSTYASFNKIEKVIVSKNPCEVPWILAQPVENYELTTKEGTVLKATVFNNYVNNVQAGESYTIRVLDVEEDITGQKDLDAGIAIVRWVPNKNSLEAAKEEVAETVEKIDY